MERKTLIITIDGPAGSGKSTISKGLATRLGGRRLDTGAIYRSFAWFAKERGVTEAPPEDLYALGLSMQLKMTDGGVVTVNGEEITHLIRTPEIGQLASRLAAIPRVRDALLELQRRLALPGPTVCEGRDVGTVVFPDAPVKFFLTASAEERARRRYEELVAKGETCTYEAILSQQKERDARDEQRAAAPLKPADDALLVDSTAMGIDEVIEFMARTVLDLGA